MDSSAENADVVTMLDVLNEEKDYSDQASAVLSGSDEKNCNGFQSRQALYSCLTCATDEVKQDFSKAIGICLACCLQCHDKHELVELYTKRNFNCDCGVKPGSVACLMDANSSKFSTQIINKYNQNFSGVYCKCHRPYPDPDSSSNDEMIQCIVCEDWYHSLHLIGKVPNSEAYSEMICDECMKTNDFLHDYSGLAVEVVETADDSAVLNVTSDEPATNEQGGDNRAAKKAKLSDDACVRPKTNDFDKPSSAYGKATFWKEGWRENLCKCTQCMKMYEAKNVAYLTDLEDTTHFYEEKGKTKEAQSSYMASLEALSQLPHVNQINAISSYNNMKEKLFEFLQTFVVNNQIVQEEDIQRFFRNMKESNDQSNVHPHFCR